MRFALMFSWSNLWSLIGFPLGAGFLKMRGIGGHEGWRWLFLWEGSITLIIGIVTFFMMPPSPTQTKAWFRPKGWFTEREETIMVMRILRDDPTKGDMHNRQGINLRQFWTALSDFNLWPLYSIALMFGIPQYPVASYLSLNLRAVGFTTTETNFLLIPYLVFGIFTMIGITVVSEALDERAFTASMEDAWMLPFLIALRFLPANPNKWTFFALQTAVLSYPYTHAIQMSWASRNAGGVANRSINASVYNMFVQVSAIVSASVFREDDKPEYRRGYTVLIAVAAFNLVVLYPGTKLYYIWRNKQRDAIWNTMTAEERTVYLKTTKDTGNRRLDFRFAH